MVKYWPSPVPAEYSNKKEVARGVKIYWQDFD
jgi:hypothetical protein